MLFLVGLGIGSEITPRAKSALDKSDFIVGYKRYISKIEPYIQGKKILSTGMKEERERIQAAVHAAQVGNIVSLVSSGDAGVYGMSGPAIQYAHSIGYTGGIEIIPGITAANAAGAVLGAPLMLDYAVISLSDLLVPWSQIETRLRGAVAGDFVIVLYNVKSNTRVEPFRKACIIIREYRHADTLCGIVWNAGDLNERSVITKLSDLELEPIDMRSCVFIGNSSTKQFGSWLVQPRGYML